MLSPINSIYFWFYYLFSLKLQIKGLNKYFFWIRVYFNVYFPFEFLTTKIKMNFYNKIINLQAILIIFIDKYIFWYIIIIWHINWNAIFLIKRSSNLISLLHVFKIFFHFWLSKKKIRNIFNLSIWVVTVIWCNVCIDIKVFCILNLNIINVIFYNNSLAIRISKLLYFLINNIIIADIFVKVNIIFRLIMLIRLFFLIHLISLIFIFIRSTISAVRFRFNSIISFYRWRLINHIHGDSRVC